MAKKPVTETVNFPSRTTASSVGLFSFARPPFSTQVQLNPALPMAHERFDFERHQHRFRHCSRVHHCHDRTVHSKDARESSSTIVSETTRLQVIERRKRIQNSLLGLQKDLINPKQILGTALAALSDETKSLHQGDNLLSGTCQCLFICHACTV